MIKMVEKSGNIKKEGSEKKKMWNKRGMQIAVLVCLSLLLSPLVGTAQTTGDTVTYQNQELIAYPNTVKPIVDNPGLYPHTVIIDTRKSEDYNSSHIPGAINIYDGNFKYPGNSTLIPVEEVTGILGDKGINESNEVIIYGKPYHYMFWMLEYLGHNDVSVLDGGFENWNTTYPDNVTNITTPPRSSTTYTATLIEDRIATTPWLFENYENPDVQIVDVRTEGEYNGTVIKPGTIRGGHIPGAYLLDFNELWEEDHEMKSAGKLSDLFSHSAVDSKGEIVSLNKSKDIVVHCYSGGRASSMYFALRLMNYTVRNYEESMKVWYNNLSLPVEAQSDSLVI